MKKTILTWALAGAFLSGALFLGSCGGNSGNESEQHEHMDGEMHEHTDGDMHEHDDMDHEEMMDSTMHDGSETGKVYYCPMHENITQDHPGKCPECGMELVLKEEG